MLIQTLLDEFKNSFPSKENIVFRDCAFPNLDNKVKVAIGMRRVGKTFFLFQTIHKLIDEKQIPWQRFLYLNFEDDRLAPCTQQKFVALVDEFYKLYPENHDQVCYLFLDEIQNVENWSQVIRRFLDTKKVQIYLSGSSAKLLSKEIATSLRGRSIATEIWPYSFKEYLSAHNIPLESRLFSQKVRDQLYQHLRNYMRQGGFPEIVNAQPIDHRQLLQDYTELVIMRDIVERHSVTNIGLLKYLIKTLIKNTGGNFSINKFANDVKSQGLTGAKNTITDYVNFIEDAYLLFPVSLHSESIRKVHSNPKKIYTIDTGVTKAYSFSLNENDGHLFENLIFLELRRQGHKVYYYLTKERYEIDFLTEDREGKRHAFQVIWTPSENLTLEREIRALDALKIELQIDGHIITPDSFLSAIHSGTNVLGIP